MPGYCASLRAALLFLLFSGAVLAAPAEPVALRWGDLPPVLQGRQLSVRLTDGATVQGKFSSLETDALSLRVAKTSDPARHPTGATILAKRDLAQITLRRHTGWKARTIGLITGGAIAVAAAGTLHAISTNEVGGWSSGSASAAAAVGSGGVGFGYLIGWLVDYARARPGQVLQILPD